MKLGIPTLCRYDLLDKLLQSAERGAVKPDGYIIIDNGGEYTVERARRHIERPDIPLDYVPMPTNIGVAAAWNKILERSAGPVVISNDDVTFTHGTFRAMCTAIESHPFVSADGWALFGQTPECTERVGAYDENFWPAYYEDVDYAIRLQKAGIPIHKVDTPIGHEGWASTKSLGDAAWLSEGRYRNLTYIIRKWGADGWQHVGSPLLHAEPFGGDAPPGWSLRAPASERMPLRWEIINRIAEHIGARSYLEIGVNRGECLRKVNIINKWGIDTEPTLEGVKACTVFSPLPSLQFFSRLAPSMKFDMIFIDGDHLATTMYREIIVSLRHLSPRGVIVLHDCNPHYEALQTVPYTGGHWTGDVWKAISFARQTPSIHCRVVDADYGVGIITRNYSPSPVIDPPAHEGPIDWNILCENRRSVLGLLNHWEWFEWFKKAWAEPG